MSLIPSGFLAHTKQPSPPVWFPRAVHVAETSAISFAASAKKIHLIRVTTLLYSPFWRFPSLLSLPPLCCFYIFSPGFFPYTLCSSVNDIPSFGVLFFIFSCFRLKDPPTFDKHIFSFCNAMAMGHIALNIVTSSSPCIAQIRISSIRFVASTHSPLWIASVAFCVAFRTIVAIGCRLPTGLVSLVFPKGECHSLTSPLDFEFTGIALSSLVSRSLSPSIASPVFLGGQLLVAVLVIGTLCFLAHP